MDDIIALAGMAPVAQRTLARLGSRAQLAQLATSARLDPEAADVIIDRGDVVARRWALPRIADARRVTTLAKGTGFDASAATRNLLVDPDVLVDALNGEHQVKALNAFCNPSTPLAERQRLLTPARCEDLVVVRGPRGSQGERAIRGQALALANPWMTATPDAWPSYVRRGLSLLPTVDRDTLLALRIRRSGWPGMDRHPSMTGVDPARMSVPQLLAARSGALDLVALDRPEATCDMVRTALQERAPGRAEFETDYVVLARAVARFGPAVAHGITPAFAGTRIKAAAWLSPGVLYLREADPAALADASTATDLLGEDEHLWRTFLSLAGSWDGTALQLAQAASRVAGIPA